MLKGKFATLQNEVDELRGKLVSAQSETLSRDLDLKQVYLEALCRCGQLIRRHTFALEWTITKRQCDIIASKISLITHTLWSAL